VKVAFVIIQNLLQAHGVQILSSCLKEAGHEVGLLFLGTSFDPTLFDKKIDSAVEAVRDADVVGISVMSNDVPVARRLTGRLRGESGKIVIWGGVHPTVMPEGCVEEADYIIRGEAERSLVQLLDCIERGADPLEADIPGLYSIRDGARAGQVSPPSRVEDLDKLPLADIDLNTQFYIPVDGSDVRQITPEAFRESGFPKGTYAMMASRGCPYTCAYCINSFLNTLYKGAPRVRYRSPARVIEELECAKAQLGAQSVRIDDDAFMSMPVSRMREFCELYTKRVGLPLYNFGASLSPRDITEEKMGLLLDAGMVYMRLGVQSASESTRTMYNRGGSVEDMRQAVSVLEKFRSRMEPPSYDVIVDNPWETDVERARTLRFLAELPKPFRLFIYSLTFFPGTPLFTRAVEEGLVSDIERDVYYKSYSHVADTYVNELLFFVRDLAREGRRFPPVVMGTLTSRWLLTSSFGKKIARLLKLVVRAVRRIVRVNHPDDLSGGAILRQHHLKGRGSKPQNGKAV
jgi:anaerobic magnesium-protoporphyrin IX monomethyl ester cyclase